MLFSDAHGRPREDYLRSTVQQVYEEIPDWVTKTGGEAIPDVLQQIDMPVADWQSSSLDSVVANDWQAIRTDSGESGASGAADDSASRTSDDSADSASDAELKKLTTRVVC